MVEGQRRRRSVEEEAGATRVIRRHVLSVDKDEEGKNKKAEQDRQEDSDEVSVDDKSSWSTLWFTVTLGTIAALLLLTVLILVRLNKNY